MRRVIVLLTAMTVRVVGYAGAALATSVLDQENTDVSTPDVPNGYNVAVAANQVLGQTFTSGMSGSLDKVSLRLGYAPGWKTWEATGTVSDSDLVVEVKAVRLDGLPTGSALGSATVPRADFGSTAVDWRDITLTQPARVIASTEYVVLVSGTVPMVCGTDCVNGTYLLNYNPNENPYSAGNLIARNQFGNWNSLGLGAADAAFKTYVSDADATAPVLNLADITQVAKSSSGAAVNFTATATDDVDGSVPVSCSVDNNPVASGDTFPLGTTQVDCSATDAAGNTANGSFEVNVVYGWSGVLQPINGGTTLNDYSDDTSSFRLGSTIPVTFKLSGDSAGITDATAKLLVAKVSDNVIGTEENADSTAAATEGNLFRYDETNDQYVFNWGTRGLEAGAYQLGIDLGDGATNTVRVSLR